MSPLDLSLQLRATDCEGASPKNEDCGPVHEQKMESNSVLVGKTKNTSCAGDCVCNRAEGGLLVCSTVCNTTVD